MPPASASASPAPGSSRAPGGRDRIAEALYTWCRQNYDAGYVFGQDELLDAGIIPDKKVDILLNATRYLVSKSLFKVHDRSNGTIGWELVEEQRAKKYTSPFGFAVLSSCLLTLLYLQPCRTFSR
jgi:hypothetical protein